MLLRGRGTFLLNFFVEHLVLLIFGFFDFFKLFFVDNLEMFASSSAVASVVATGALGAPAPPSTGRELLEARLSATLMNANVKDSSDLFSSQMST